MILIFLSVLNINTLDKIISPKSIAWNGDSEIIYTSDLSSYILKYNINDKTISPIFTQQGYNDYLSLSPDGKFIAFTNSFLQTDWGSVDAGFKYQSDYRGPADAVLQVGINAALTFVK